MRVIARVGKRSWVMEVSRRKGGGQVVQSEGGTRSDGEPRQGESHGFDVEGTGVLRTVRRGGRALEAFVSPQPRSGRPRETTYDVTVGGRLYEVRVGDSLGDGPGDAALLEESGPVQVRSIMPGRVVAVLVAPGQAVKGGEGLVVVEAMKMENEITAPRAGTVQAVPAVKGLPVEAGAVLVTLE
jgi:pyruvate carboxylase subunit B